MATEKGREGGEGAVREGRRGGGLKKRVQCREGAGTQKWQEVMRKEGSEKTRPVYLTGC